MVEAGESSGTLDTVLDRVAMQIEKETQIKRRVKSAMVYPAVVITFASLVLTFMLMFIVPVFVNVFDQLNGQLPMPTQIVMHMSYALRRYWFVIFPAIGAMHLRVPPLQATPSRAGRSGIASSCRIPMKIGDVVHKIALARFSRTLSTLVSAGVDIIKALEITGATAGNWVVEQSLDHDVRSASTRASRSASRWPDDPVFPPMVSQMVKIGEETGELDKMLGKIADFYEDEVDASIQSLTSIIEPMLMIGVGAMVGTIVIAMYLPDVQDAHADQVAAPARRASDRQESRLEVLAHGSPERGAARFELLAVPDHDRAEAQHQGDVADDDQHVGDVERDPVAVADEERVRDVEAVCARRQDVPEHAAGEQCSTDRDHSRRYERECRRPDEQHARADEPDIGTVVIAPNTGW